MKVLEGSKVKVPVTLKGPNPSRVPATPAKIIDPSSESPSPESPETNKTSETVNVCNVAQLKPQLQPKAVAKAKQFLDRIDTRKKNIFGTAESGSQGGSKIGGKHHSGDDDADHDFKKQKTTGGVQKTTGGVAVGVDINRDPPSKKVSSVTSKLSAPVLRGTRMVSGSKNMLQQGWLLAAGIMLVQGWLLAARLILLRCEILMLLHRGLLGLLLIGSQQPITRRRQWKLI